MKPFRIAAGFLAVSVLMGGLQVAHAQFRVYEGQVREPSETFSRQDPRIRGPLEVTVQSEADRQRVEAIRRPVGERVVVRGDRPQRSDGETVVVEQWPSEALTGRQQVERDAAVGEPMRSGHDWIAGLHGYTIGVAKAARSHAPESSTPMTTSTATSSLPASEAESVWRGTGAERERSMTGVAGYAVMEQPTRKHRPY